MLLSNHSFPTRRSSDLQRTRGPPARRRGPGGTHRERWHRGVRRLLGRSSPLHRDRKSTRLNSSHVAISYAVSCLKKKKINCPTTLLLSVCINDVDQHRE